MSVNDASALYQFARAGAGLALIPEFLAEEDITDGVMEYVLPDWHFDDIGIYAVWPQNAPKHGLTRFLVDHLAS
jgi:DNA-binding transcriptional LysR family regulator